MPPDGRHLPSLLRVLIAYRLRKHNNSGFVARGSRQFNPAVPTVSAVMPIAVVLRRAAVFAICIVISATFAASAGADTDSDPAHADAAPPAGGRVPSGDPATVNTPDGWLLTLGAKDEMQLSVQ